MPRAPDTFIYREDPLLDEQMLPVRTAFFLPANVAALKSQLDALAISVTQPGLLDRMEAAYRADDGARRLELGVATGAAPLPPLLERLNRAVVEDLQRALASGGQEFHARFLDDTRAFLGDDLRGIYRHYSEKPPLQRERLHARDADQIDMYRWLSD